MLQQGAHLRGCVARDLGEVLNVRPCAGMLAHSQARAFATFATLARAYREEQVANGLVVYLEVAYLDGVLRAWVRVMRRLAVGAKCRHEARREAWSRGGSSHRVRLATTRLPVGKDGHIVAICRGGEQPTGERVEDDLLVCLRVRCGE